MKSSIRNVIIVLVIINLLLGGAAYFVVSYITDLTMKSQTLRSEVALAEGRVARMSALQATVRDIADDTQVLEGYFVDDDLLIRLLESIESFGPRTRTEIVITDVEETILMSDEQERDAVQLSVEISGSWSQVQGALLLIETIPFVQHITGLELTAEAEKVNPLWEANVTMYVLLQ